MLKESTALTLHDKIMMPHLLYPFSCHLLGFILKEFQHKQKIKSYFLLENERVTNYNKATGEENIQILYLYPLSTLKYEYYSAKVLH